jgi:hypothetical protein
MPADACHTHRQRVTTCEHSASCHATLLTGPAAGPPCSAHTRRTQPCAAAMRSTHNTMQSGHTAVAIFGQQPSHDTRSRESRPSNAACSRRCAPPGRSHQATSRHRATRLELSSKLPVMTRDDGPPARLEAGQGIHEVLPAKRPRKQDLRRVATGAPLVGTQGWWFVDVTLEQLGVDVSPCQCSSSDSTAVRAACTAAFMGER